MLCLHIWGEHDHPTMQTSNMQGGNGLILYFRIENMNQAKENLRTMNNKIEREIEISPTFSKKGVFIT